jgi:hypothetical protein
MEQVLPRYYVQDIKKIPTRNEYNRREYVTESKRFYWTKVYTKMYNKEKTNRLLSRKGKTDNNLKIKKQTTIEDINKLYSFNKYRLSQTTKSDNYNSNNKSTTKEVINEGNQTQQGISSNIYDTKAFATWYKRTAEKQKLRIKISSDQLSKGN